MNWLSRNQNDRLFPIIHFVLRTSLIAYEGLKCIYWSYEEVRNPTESKWIIEKFFELYWLSVSH